ncbi:MAG: MFS transporter [Spirochaetales bacterium]|nr:MFS transporter [Spirochaetales bacterium]
MNGNKNNMFTPERWLTSFLCVWIPQNISLFGAGLVQFALIWWLTSATNSAIIVSMAAAIALIPKAILNPFIGALVDKGNRAFIMIISCLCLAGCSIILAFLFLGGIVQTWHVLITLLIRAIADTFHNKAMMTSTSLMVQPHHLTRIAGINQAFYGVIMFVTPALGALLLKMSSFTTIMIIDFAGATLAVLPLFFIRIPQPSSYNQSNKRLNFRLLLTDIAEGFRYLQHWPGAVGMLVLSAMMNFIMQPYFSLIAIFVRATLQGGEIEFGLLGAMVGLGFLSGGIILGIWQGHPRKMVTSLTGMMGAGVAVMVSGSLAFAGIIPELACFFLAGAMMPLCMGPIQALVQKTVKKNMQGRIFSIMECVSTSVAPVSLLLAGKIFDIFSPEVWYIGGGLTAIGIALFGFMKRKIRNLGTVASY